MSKRLNKLTFALVSTCLTLSSFGISDFANATSWQSIPPAGFDLQAHRGGRGEQTEESLEGFKRSMELGVTTLELDIEITKDNVPLVWHDPIIDPTKCRDTAPAEKNDPSFPYVGKIIRNLTYKQVETLNCDLKLTSFPNQEPIKNNKIATLPELFDLANSLGATTQRFNIESKVEAAHPEQSAQPQVFVNIMTNVVNKYHKEPYVEWQSFDWRTLPMFKKATPTIPLVALWDNTTWIPNSPWLDGIKVESVNNDPLLGAQKIGAQIASPAFADSANQTPNGATSYVVTPEFVKHAHDLGLKVVPWTVDTETDMKAMIKAKADGIITDYPTKARKVMQESGLPLPTGF